jgi:hypothetical protein
VPNNYVQEVNLQRTHPHLRAIPLPPTAWPLSDAFSGSPLMLILLSSNSRHPL